MGGKFHLKLNICETDSEQEDEKNFKKRVKKCLKLLKEKRFEQVRSGHVISTDSCPVVCSRSLALVVCRCKLVDIDLYGRLGQNQFGSQM